jgi:hypothetical protein
MILVSSTFYLITKEWGNDPISWKDYNEKPQNRTKITKFERGMKLSVKKTPINFLLINVIGGSN